MLIYHAILLLLGWPCVRSNETEKPPGEDIFDQIATASENLGLSYETHHFISKPTPIPTAASTSRVAILHYENSNGFIPITPMVATPSVSPDTLVTNANRSTGEEDRLSIGSPNGTAREVFQNDPAFSSEARMLLNIGVPGADRRSFDAPDGQNEFEILKVTNETPAIANYHDFYQKMQNKLNQGRGANDGGRYQEADESSSGRTAAQNQRTKERIKKIEKYLTKFHGDPESRNSETHRNYYSFVNGNAKTSSGQSKTTFGQEKVQSNFHQQSAGTNYDVYGESPVNHQRTSPTVRSNYENSDTGTRPSHKSHGSASPKNRHVNSKPVVVVEPSDYKTSVRYGSEQNSPRVSSVDHYRNQKLHGEPDDVESRANPEDRYGVSYDRNEESVDYSEESDDYSEITEKPKRPHKIRRRPHGLDNSRRLVKEHRGQPSSDDQSEDSRKHNSPTRSKLHRPKSKPSYWHDDDSSDATSEESSEEHKHNVKSSGSAKPDGGGPKKHVARGHGPTKWSQVGPNIEVSHSSGFEIDQIDKPKLLVPVNINLVPVSGFDHSTALGNSQGFDFTNVPKFVTAAPIVSSPTPLLSTSQSIVTPNIARPTHAAKNVQNAINSNYVLSTAVPDIIVGRNTYQNQIQAVLLPQMNVNKYASNVRASYLPSTVSPMFTVTQAPNQNLQHLNPTVQSIPVQNFHSTVSPRPANSQNVHHVTINPTSPTVQPQFVVPQPVIHSFPVNGPYNGHANYNILVNPNGLHGQNLIQHGNPNSPGVNVQNTTPSSTTSQPDPPANNNLSESESQRKKSTGQNSDGHYLATATYAVGNAEKQQKNNNAGDKYSSNSNEHSNNNNYYNENQGNQQTVRSHLPQDFYQFYRQDQDPNTKQYLQPAHEVPTMYQSSHGIPINFNNQNYATASGQLQEQQSVLSPTIVAHGPRDQNQQILKAANDIFEQTWKQLQQLQTNEDATRNMPYQHIYRVNDNLGSGSNVNANVANALPGTSTNQMKAHLPILGTQNVEIRNPNIKPSPVDLTFVNPYGSVNHYQAAVLTTPIPIFTTVASFLTPRPTILGGTSTESANLHNYVNTLTQIGAHTNQVNKYETRPDATNQDNQHSQLYNPIHFVPNVDLMRSQSMLNSKITEPLPNQLNLVPVIPGGNFYKNTYGAQTELVQKPRLSNDLAKYAEEMFKESLKTIYSTHKWNNDRRSRGNYTAAELSDLVKLNGELQRFKASLPDPNYSGKDVLEAHHSETKIRTTEPSGTTKKPNLSVAAIEQLFKAAVKQSLPPPSDSSHSSRHKNRQNQGHSSSRPGSSNKHRLSNYLTPPKPNSFLSKSPFNDTPKPVKKRPPSRYSSNSSSRPTRPKSASGPEASASSQSGVHANGPHYEKFRPSRYSREKDSHRHFDHSDYRTDQNFEHYPTFTTSSSNEEDSFKPSSGEQSTKTEYFDINHPRTHNLLGLLMKNKQLPTGTAQSFFRDDDDLRHYFENEKRRMHMQFYDENINNFHKKADGRPVNMAPPAPPNLQQIRYYPG